MSFANGRNFRIPLRLIVFGVSSGSLLIADWDTLPAISRPQNPIGEDDQSKLPFEGFIH